MRVLGLLLVAIGVLMIRKPLLFERTLIDKGVYRYDQINACPGNNAIISYGPTPIAFCFFGSLLIIHVNFSCYAGSCLRTCTIVLVYFRILSVVEFVTLSGQRPKLISRSSSCVCMFEVLLLLLPLNFAGFL